MLILSSCSAENELASAGRGNEILFSVEEEPLKPDSTAGGAATRAAKVTTVSSFKVYAYDASGNTVINGATYTKNSSGNWSSSTNTSWPSGTVTFYAFSPADNSSVTFNTSNKQLTYTAPTAQGSQQDVLYAYASSSRPANNTIGLTFNHANAAFSVKASLASGCTATVNVSGVKLVNIKPTNTLTVSSGSASASGSNISTDVAINSTTLTTTAQTISSSPLMLPPQSVTAWSGTSALANTYLAVTCKVQANDKYVVGSASANGTVYVPMNKTLNKGEDNSVNLVFGNEENGARSYGRDANGNRILVSEKKEKELFNTHVAVDLGLSVKWASDVFWTNYLDVTSGSATDPTSGYAFYFGYSRYGTLSTNAEWWSETYYPSGSWSAPTKDQVQELLDNCTMTIDTVLVSYTPQEVNSLGYLMMVALFATSENDTVANVPGYRFTSKINGNSIFFPSVGYLQDNGIDTSHGGSGLDFQGTGSNGYYWTSSSANGVYYFLEWGPDANGNELSPHLSTTTEANSWYAVKFVSP